MRKFCARIAAYAALSAGIACSGGEIATPLSLTPLSPAGSARYALLSTPGLTAQFKSKTAAGLCWDAGGSTRISLRTCDGAAGFQYFTLQATGELKFGNGCLIAWGDTGADGDALTAYSCGSASSRWTFTAAEEIRSFNNKCLQTQSTGAAGETVILMSCTGATNQKWSNAAGETAPPVPVATVSVSTAAASITAGSTTQATASVQDASQNVLSDRMVVWSSSDNTIASVSATGLITGVAPGSANISASVDGKSGLAPISVTSGPASPSGGSLATGVIGQVRTALASALCWDATGTTLVTLRACGTALAPQQFSVLASGEIRLGSSCLVPWGDHGVDGDPLTVYICGGNTSKWTVSAAQEIRSFNNKCLQTSGAGSAGDRMILQPCTGALNQKWTNSAVASPPAIPPVTPPDPPAPPAVPVPVAVATVAVSLDPPSVTAGTGATATVLVKDASGNALTGRTTTWTSSSPSVATVTSTGTVASLTAGSTIISATADGKTGSATLTVTAPATGGGSFALGSPALIKTLLPSGLCWDAGGSTRVSLRSCIPAAGYQLFTLAASGEVRLGNSCLVPWGDHGVDGDPLTVYICGGATSKWTFTTAQEIRSFNNKCLQVQSTGLAGETVILASCSGATSQKWSNASASVPVTPPVTPVPPTPAPVATVGVSLTASGLAVGVKTQATATVRDANNVALTDRTVSWASSNLAVATVTSAGLVTASGAGTASIIATVEGKTGSATVTVTAPTTGGTPSGYFIATNGSAGGDGSLTRPWDISTALAHPARVQAGDTLWIRGGVYTGQFTSYLHGLAGKPVIVRQYPGERATIDGGVAIRGAYSWFWGFEVMNSNLGALVTAVDVYGAGTKVINMIVHDAAGNGIGLWEGANDAELNGNVVYNVGRAGSSAGRYAHGIYFQNVTTSKRLIDNVVLNSYSYNYHGYTENAGLNNLYLEGNVSFNAGSFVTYGGAEFLVGGQQPVRNLTFTNNFSYRGGGLNARNEFGYGAPTPVGNSITNNYLAGATKMSYLDGVTFTGNTLVNAAREMLEIYQNDNQSLGSGFVFANNVYRAPNARDIAAFRRVVNGGTGYSFAQWQAFGYDRNSDFQIAAASGTTTAVRANQYEPGRANIVVYNWDHLGSVSVNLNGILAPGTRFEIREVQDYYGSVAVSGTYNGGSISLPMGAVTAVRPLGPIETPAPSTGTEFHTFVVIPKP